MARLALLLGLLLPATALAGGETLIMEARVGPRRPDADKHVANLALSLEGEEALGGEALARRLERLVSRPAGAEAKPEDLQQLVTEGRRFFIEGQFNDAIKILARAQQALQANPALVATDQRLRTSLYQAILYLAHARLRLGKTNEARRLVTAVLRGFPERTLSRARYGPELVALHEEVRRDMGKLPRAGLTIKTRTPGCSLFLNERYVGISPITVNGLYPGSYRLFLQRPGQRGRVHMVQLFGKDLSLELDLDLDRALDTAGRVSLVYADHETRERWQVRHAATLARRMGAARVILLEQEELDGNPALGATLVSAGEGTALRAARISLAPSKEAPSRVTRLARFISTGEATDGLEVHMGLAAMEQESGSGSGRGAFGWLRWVSLGVAVAGLAAGIPLIMVDGQKTCDTPEGVLCPEYMDTLAGGAALTAVGGAAAVAAGVFFYLHARAEAPAEQISVAPWVGPAGVGASARLTW